MKLLRKLIKGVAVTVLILNFVFATGVVLFAKEQGTYESGRKDDFAELFYENGDLKARGTGQSGREKSSWEFYDKSGDLFRTETYNVGKLHGLSKIFSEHGRLISP